MAEPRSIRPIARQLQGADESKAREAFVDFIQVVGPQIEAYLRVQLNANLADIPDTMRATWRKVWLARREIDPYGHPRAWGVRIAIRELRSLHSQRSSELAAATPEPARPLGRLLSATATGHDAADTETTGPEAHIAPFRLVATGSAKTDAYLHDAFRYARSRRAGAIDANEVAGSIKLPMLVKVGDPERWQPPAEFDTHTQLGHIVSGRGTAQALEALEYDPNVRGIEASRDISTTECRQSVSFVRATTVQTPPLSESGDGCLVAVIDDGIDVLHGAFMDNHGNSRIVEIWDQLDDSGPPPREVHPGLSLDYGTIHTAAQIGDYVANGAVPPELVGSWQHGTHVTSIAAGRACGRFGGGMSPGARILFVRYRLQTGPDDPNSVGYSTSHVDALSYIREVARELNRPVVVNVSQGMNAGAHDGSSLLEVAFDEFSGRGRKPGLVVVKSAGNERGRNGHAKLTMISCGQDVLKWQANAAQRNEDVIEIWFKASDEYRFRLKTPGDDRSQQATWNQPSVNGQFASGNTFSLSYTRRHHDNGDSRLLVVIRSGSGAAIEPGAWQLEIEAVSVRTNGIIHAWVERDNNRPIEFTTHQDEEITLSIPGTAHSVITVGAVTADSPFRNTENSSYGPTRDEREKPELVAPGSSIEAALAGSSTDVNWMSGTSMAASHVTGAVALLLSRRSKEPHVEVPNASQIRTAILQTAQNYNGHFTPSYGFGILDAEALVREFDPPAP